MLVSAQLRAGRALVRWSAEDLARHAHLALPLVHRAEAASGAPPLSDHDVSAMRRALEAAGVLFLDPHLEGPGVRLRKDVMPKSDHDFVSDGNEG